MNWTGCDLRGDISLSRCFVRFRADHCELTDAMKNMSVRQLHTCGLGVRLEVQCRRYLVEFSFQAEETFR
jgi:hypothetical protein